MSGGERTSVTTSSYVALVCLAFSIHSPVQLLTSFPVNPAKDVA